MASIFVGGKPDGYFQDLQDRRKLWKRPKFWIILVLAITIIGAVVASIVLLRGEPEEESWERETLVIWRFKDDEIFDGKDQIEERSSIERNVKQKTAHAARSIAGEKCAAKGLSAVPEVWQKRFNVTGYTMCIKKSSGPGGNCFFTAVSSLLAIDKDHVYPEYMKNGLLLRKAVLENHFQYSLDESKNMTETKILMDTLQSLVDSSGEDLSKHPSRYAGEFLFNYTSIFEGEFVRNNGTREILDTEAKKAHRFFEMLSDHSVTLGGQSYIAWTQEYLGSSIFIIYSSRAKFIITDFFSDPSKNEIRSIMVLINQGEHYEGIAFVSKENEVLSVLESENFAMKVAEMYKADMSRDLV